jgi:hypothetical protein
MLTPFLLPPMENIVKQETAVGVSRQLGGGVG